MAGSTRAKVGVFDSGIGGLNVLCECLKAAHGVTFYYFGDNCNAPYGSKGKEEIGILVERGLHILARRRIDVAVLACNTASAVCLESMRRKFPFPIVGMEPAISPAAKKFRRILVLCTPRTAESERLRRLIARHPAAEIEVFAPKDLAWAIEKNLLEKEPLLLEDHLPGGDTMPSFWAVRTIPFSVTRSPHFTARRSLTGERGRLHASLHCSG